MFDGGIRAIVFDFDGTLVDSNHVKRLAYDVAFAHIPDANRYIPTALRKYPDRDRRFIIDHIVQLLHANRRVRRGDVDHLRALALRRYARYCRSAVAAADDFPGVEATLRVLARTYRIAINSGTPQGQLVNLIRARSWGKYCEVVLGAPVTKSQNLERIARQLSLEARQMVFLGDSAVDAKAAAAFGCTFLHVAHQSRSLSSWSRIAAINELPQVLAGLNV